MRPFFTIIIPSKNSYPRIKHTISSILRIIYPKSRFEVIIVDSSDDAKTKNFLRKIRRGNFHVFFITPTKERNANIARNVGAKKARSNNLLFLDDDSILSSKWLDDYSHFVNNENNIVAGPVQIRGNGLLSKYFRNSLRPVELNFRKKYFIDKKNFHKTSLPLATNLFVKKSILQNLNFFNPNTPGFDETEFLYRAVKRGYRIFVIPFARVKTTYPKSILKTIQTYSRLGKGFGYFAAKHANSNFTKTRVKMFALFDILMMFLLYLLLSNSYLFLTFFILTLFAAYFILSHAKSRVLMPFFAIMDFFLIGVIYQISAIFFVYYSKVRRYF